MDDTLQAQARWFHLTPGRVVIGLLAVEGLLWASERFGWLGWHKGYAVLTGVAVVAAAFAAMTLWFIVALLFRLRFQFSIRSLLVLVVAVALPFSWLGVEMKRAREQRATVETIRTNGGEAWYCDVHHLLWTRIPVATAPEWKWLWAVLDDDFFNDVVSVNMGSPSEENSVADGDLECLVQLPQLKSLFFHYLNKPKITDAGLGHLRGLTHLQYLDIQGTAVTAEGVARLQQALPNCKIIR